MKELWVNFINNFGGEYNAREQFDKLCIELLEYHFPGKQIINANKIDRLDSFHDLLLVYLPKLFTDSLNVSRKSQIRKAFNKTLEAIEQHNLKVFKWVLCTSHILTQSELQWWNQWKYKKQEDYNIEIELLDGNTIINLLKEYDIYEKWFVPQAKEEKQYQQTKQANSREYEDLDSLEETAHLEIVNAETTDTNQETEPIETEPEETGQEPASQPAEENSIQETITEAQPTTDNTTGANANVQPENKENIEPQEPEQEQAPAQEQEANISNDEQKPIAEKFEKKRKIWTKIKQHVEELEPEAKEKFQKFREISKVNLEKFKDKPQDEEEVQNSKILDLFMKARKAEMDKNYDQALFYYEILNQRKDEVKEKLTAKLPEIERSLKYVDKQIDYEALILQGDIKLAKGYKLEALEYYEEAIKLNDQNPEAKLKYNETLGDLMIENGLYSEAVKAYDEALKNLKGLYEEHRKKLEYKLKLAKNLQRFSSIRKFIIVSDIFLAYAKYIEEKHLDEKLVNPAEYDHLDKAGIALSGVIIFIFLLLAGIPFIKNMIINNINASATYVNAQSTASLYSVAMEKGKHYILKLSKNPHRLDLIDSSLYAFNRAFFYEPTAAAKKYKLAAENHRNFLMENTQKLISLNNYKPVAKVDKAIKLVKIQVPLSNGSYLAKYAYIDTANRLITPPYFDFDNYRYLTPQAIQFHHGQAWTCIRINGKCYYFKINRKGHKISVGFPETKLRKPNGK